MVGTAASCQPTPVERQSKTEFVAFGKRLRAKLAPVGELELLFADRVIVRRQRFWDRRRPNLRESLAHSV